MLGKLDHFLTLYTRINPKWIKDFNIRPETRKPLEENIGSRLVYITLRSVFLDMSPQEGETKENKQMKLQRIQKVLHREKQTN